MNESSFLSHLTRQWGGISLRGLAARSFGMTTFIWPEPILVALTLACGAYVVFDGVFAQMAAFRIRDQQKPLWPIVIVGLVGVSAGVATFIWPDITALSLLLLIVVWALVMGASQIATAIHIRKTLDNEWMLDLSSVIAMIFGTVIIFYRPGRRPRRRVDGRRIRDSIWVAAHRARFPAQELRDAVGISLEQRSPAAKLKRLRDNLSALGDPAISGKAAPKAGLANRINKGT